MPNPVAHFAINADEPERARQFYEDAFGWSFSAWGPPDFFHIDTGDEGLRGALQRRRNLVADKPIHGFECSIAVEDIDATTKKVLEAGGKVVMEKAEIQGVGQLIFFEDTEGNVAGAMQYTKR